VHESQLFLEALTKGGPAERAAFLDAACGGDPNLRAAVDGLLHAHDTKPDFLERPALGDTPLDLSATVRSPELPPCAEQPGAVLAGRYTLVEPIGEGGMGSVWKALQTEPVRRLVAVKLIKRGMDSRQVLARFEAERQALAIMDHPNIATVLDAGTAPDGRPFFAMELVDGVPITKLGDEHRLTIRQRLELFIQVCEAVQHAHQKGVIHRDIKPSNVLVATRDGRPVPKVIDFGVAKATSQPLTEQTLDTGPGTMIGTPEYMSPEQASFNNLDVDTRSDVYSLGVLLYELLAGSPPHSWKEAGQAGLLEFLRVIREEEPPRPSTRLTAAQTNPTIAESRQSDPMRLTRAVRGELDWIVMTTLEKDRTRRYESAAALGTDVQRYLSGEPVLAVPPTRGYRLRKFVSRNKLMLFTMVVLLVAIFSIAGSIGWAARDRAAREAEADRELDRQIGEASRLRDRGDRAAARTEVNRIRGLLWNGGRDGQRQHLAEIVKDLDMVDRLIDIRLRMLLELDKLDEVNLAYTAAFRDYGIDVLSLDPGAAGQRLCGSAIREDLVTALDDWYPVRVTLRRLFVFKEGARLWRAAEAKPDSPPPRPKELAGFDVKERAFVTVVSQADSDEWRTLVRTAAVVDDHQALEELANQRNSVGLRPSTALLLARALTSGNSTAKAKLKALEVLFMAQERSPTDLGLNLELARSLEACRPPRLEEAVGFLRAAVTADPERPVLHKRLGDLLSKAGRSNQAVAAYRSAVRLRPEYWVNHSALGGGLQDMWDWHGAIASFSDAMDRGAASADVWYGRGSSYARLGRWREATEDLTKAVNLRPNHGLTRFVLAASRLQAGDPEGYRKTCAEGIARVPSGKVTDSDYNLVRACGLAPDAVADPNIPIQLMEQFVRTDPHGWTHHALALAYYRAGQYEKAIAQAEKSRKLDSRWEGLTPVNGLVLALSYQQLANPEKAKEELKQTIDRLERGARETPAPKTFPGSLVEELACQILLREAKDAIPGVSR
jgi:serine/threonine protein kinase/tetratricopeptide (TPR) repeat protein